MKLKGFNLVKYFIYSALCRKNLEKYYSLKSSIFRILARLGFYEHQQIAMLKRFVDPGDTVIDGGANFGIYTDELIDAVGKRGKVIAVEPLVAISSFLESRFKSRHNVFVQTNALSNSSGNTVKISIPFIHKDLPEPALASLEKLSVDHITNETKTITIDELAKKYGPISFIKLDLEGHELEALRGGTTCLLNDRPIVQFEENNMKVMSQNFLEFADRMNYSLQELVNGDLHDVDTEKVSKNYNFYLVPKK
jgi:FkbM family methyltransferase